MKPANLEALYRENFQRVYNYAYYRLLDPMMAEDLTSIVFVKAAESFDRFDPSKAKFSTWVMRIAHNALVDYYRTRKTDAPLGNLGEHEPACEDDYPALDDHAAEVLAVSWQNKQVSSSIFFCQIIAVFWPRKFEILPNLQFRT